MFRNKSITKKSAATVLLVFLSIFTLYAQKVTVSGKITDQSTGEVMIGAVVGGDGGSSVSNVGGFYTLVLSPGL